MLAKTWQEVDQGFLVELRDLSLEESHKETHGGDPRDNAALPTEVTKLLEEYTDVFHLPTGLPPNREIDHQIVLKEGQGPVNVRPYKYAHV